MTIDGVRDRSVLRFGTRTVAGDRALVMAIVNRTPDSFYDRGATFSDDAAMAAVDRAVAFSRNAPPHHIPSMATDLLRGNRIELPWLSGKLVELGRRHNVPTPTHALMYAALKPYIMGTPA